MEKKKHSRKKFTAKHIIFNRKVLVREHIIIKKEKGHISLRSLGEISKRKSR